MSSSSLWVLLKRHSIANVVNRNIGTRVGSFPMRSISSKSSSSSSISNHDYSNKNHFLTSSSSSSSVSIRSFGRKAGKMGKHLQNLEELAHVQAKQKKKTSVAMDSDSKDITTTATSTTHTQNHSDINQIQDIYIEEDEHETSFDHGGAKDHDPNHHPTLPSVLEVKARMMKVVLATQNSFKAIRGSEPSPELFDSVQVHVYGSSSPLHSVAQVVITSPTLATLSCFDPQTAPHVRDAIRAMPGMNFNPTIEDGAVLVPIPRISAETRKAIVKQLGQVAESTKQRIRRIRRAALDVVKKAKDGKMEGISEDDAFRCGKEIDVVTEECMKSLHDAVLKKQNDIMSV